MIDITDKKRYLNKFGQFLLGYNHFYTKLDKKAINVFIQKNNSLYKITTTKNDKIASIMLLVCELAIVIMLLVINTSEMGMQIPISLLTNLFVLVMIAQIITLLFFSESIIDTKTGTITKKIKFFYLIINKQGYHLSQCISIVKEPDPETNGTGNILRIKLRVESKIKKLKNKINNNEDQNKLVDELLLETKAFFTPQGFEPKKQKHEKEKHYESIMDIIRKLEEGKGLLNKSFVIMVSLMLGLGIMYQIVLQNSMQLRTLYEILLVVLILGLGAIASGIAKIANDFLPSNQPEKVNKENQISEFVQWKFQEGMRSAQKTSLLSFCIYIILEATGLNYLNRDATILTVASGIGIYMIFGVWYLLSDKIEDKNKKENIGSKIPDDSFKIILLGFLNFIIILMIIFQFMYPLMPADD